LLLCTELTFHIELILVLTIYGLSEQGPVVGSRHWSLPSSHLLVLSAVLDLLEPVSFDLSWRRLLSAQCWEGLLILKIRSILAIHAGTLGALK
jgi:hypothetical protein